MVEAAAVVVECGAKASFQLGKGEVTDGDEGQTSQSRQKFTKRSPEPRASEIAKDNVQWSAQNFSVAFSVGGVRCG